MLATDPRPECLRGVSLELTGPIRVSKPLFARRLPAALRAIYAVEPVFAALCLICLVPLLVILAVIIRAASGASPLVAHKRVGRYGKAIWVYKFRTMWPRTAPARQSGFLVEKVADEQPRLKLGPDPRVTSRFASFCRRHSLDELPQLALVVAGQMSIVGPRPITRFELHEYYDLEAMDVLLLRPGLTGLWQVRGRSRLTYRQRKRFDLFLVRRFSLGLYCRIIALTIPNLVCARNAW